MNFKNMFNKKIKIQNLKNIFKQIYLKYYKNQQSNNSQKLIQNPSKKEEVLKLIPMQKSQVILTSHT